jgi:hypothetical protein
MMTPPPTAGASVGHQALNAPPALTPAALQTVNINSHIHVDLDMVEPYYPQWCCYIDVTIGKFGPDRCAVRSGHVTLRLHPR